MGTNGHTPDDQHASLSLRLRARPAQAFLLRAQLRLWLARQHAAEDDILDILVAATEAFDNAVLHAGQPRSIAVQVEARNSHGVVEIVIRDHGHWAGRLSPGSGLGFHLLHALMDSVDLQTTSEGTTVRLTRTLSPRLTDVDEVATERARHRLELLWRSPIFAPLPGVMLERLAGRLIPASVSADETIIREGDYGDRFYLIAAGRVEVKAESRHVATLGPGDHVGEIALLRDLPRTATIVAKNPVELYAFTRNDFLSAVTSHQASTRAAERTAALRLTELEAVLGSTSFPAA